MIMSLVLIVGLAAVFGFFLGVYFFLYRVKLNPAARWPAAIIGGIITAGLMVGLSFVVLWPPMNLFVTAGALLLAGVVTIVTLGGSARGKRQQAYETEVVLLGGSAGTRNSQDGGIDDEDLDAFGTDIDARARS